MKTISAAAFLAGALFAHDAAAQHSRDLVPLSEYAAQPSDTISPSYVYQRCGALFLGTYLYGGSNFSADQQNNILSTVHALTVYSTYNRLTVRSRRQGLPEQDIIARDGESELEATRADIEALADVIKERQAENFRMTGSAMTGDALLEGDLQICAPIAQEAVDALQ